MHLGIPLMRDDPDDPALSTMQRMVDPKDLGIPWGPDVASREAMRIAHMFDPTVWWHPNIRYSLQNIEAGVYRLTKINRHGERAVKGVDDFVPPFAFYKVPHATLRAERAVPKLDELKLFAEGMAVGGEQLCLSTPDPDFMRWTYENHIAAGVEIGQKVEAKVEGGMIRGIIDDIFLDEVTLRINHTEEMGVDVRWVRRFYEEGDTVKVVKISYPNCEDKLGKRVKVVKATHLNREDEVASHLNREGWVVGIREGEIEVFDRNANEHVGRCSVGQT